MVAVGSSVLVGVAARVGVRVVTATATGTFGGCVGDGVLTGGVDVRPGESGVRPGAEQAVTSSASARNRIEHRMIIPSRGVV